MRPSLLPTPRSTLRPSGPQSLLVGLALLALGLLALAGCSANTGADALLAARVNGRPITFAQYDSMLRFTTAGSALQGQTADLQSSAGRGVLAMDQQSALVWLLNRELGRDELATQKLSVTPTDRKSAQDSINSYLTTVRQNLQTQPDNAQLQALNASLTPDVTQIIADRLAIEQALAERGTFPTAHVRAIYTDTQATAAQLLRQVQQGADFGKLAHDKSTDPTSAGAYGDLGTVYVGQISPEFDQAVFAPHARPQKYVIAQAGTQYGLFEVTAIGKKAIAKDQVNQVGIPVVDAYLATVAQPRSHVEQYVTVS